MERNDRQNQFITGCRQRHGARPSPTHHSHYLNCHNGRCAITLTKKFGGAIVITRFAPTVSILSLPKKEINDVILHRNAHTNKSLARKHARIGYALYVAGQPISACQSDDQRRGYYNAKLAELAAADCDTQAYLSQAVRA